MTNLADNIRERMYELKLTQKQLAEKVGISQVMVHKLLSGKVLSTGRVVDIARVLECDPYWLVHGEKDYYKFLEPDDPIADMEWDMSYSNNSIRIPLITWDQAASWDRIRKDFGADDAIEWKLTSPSVGKGAFALKVVDDIMSSSSKSLTSIPEGAVVLVDPDAEVESGKIILVKRETSKPMLKKYIVDGPQKYLKPLNPDYEVMKMDDNYQILGVAIKFEFDLV